MTTRLAILGTSEIALRRFLPSLSRVPELEYVGVGSRSIERTEPFVAAAGGRGYGSYDEVLADDGVDAVYLPLPPALHHQWALRALAAGKHVLLEKPATVTLAETQDVLAAARDQGLAVCVNYMYAHHVQLAEVRRLVAAGEVGEVRGYRARFGFPRRPAGDFRYDKSLGGGALLDCGCYPLHLAGVLLGDQATVVAASLQSAHGLDVDTHGSATVASADGGTVQVAFGLDNDYRCELEVWGEKGSLLATRIFTAGTGFNPSAVLTAGGQQRTVELPEDDQFAASLRHFVACLADPGLAERERVAIEAQSQRIEDARRLAGR